MARDAEIKLNLDIRDFISNLKRLSPELQKALTVDQALPGVTKYRTELEKTSDITSHIAKDGKSLTGAYNPKNLERWEVELEGILKTTDQINKVNEQLKDFGITDGVDAQKRLKSLSSAIGGSKDKEAARERFETAKALVAQRDTLVSIFNTQANQLNPAQREHYNAIVQSGQAIQANEDRITAINAAYNEAVVNTRQRTLEEQKATAIIGEENRQSEQLSETERKVAENAQQTADAMKEAAQATGEANAKTTRSGVDEATQNAGAGAEKAEDEYTKLRDTIIMLKADVMQVNDAMKADPAKDNIAELIRRYRTLSDAKKQMESMGLPAELDGTYTTVLRLLEQLNVQIKEYKVNMSQVHTVNEKSSKSWNFLRSAISALKSGFKSLSKNADRVRSSFNSMAKSMRSNFKHLITSVTKYVFGFRSLFFLIRRLRKYIGEGIKNMAQFNDGNNHVNESITRLLSSLLYLKNAWATAFSPILQYVTGWLEALIDKLADAGNAFSRFLGSLLGTGTVFQAVKVDAADYAESLDKAAGSAGSAADKTKKLTDRLAAFDDLNVLGIDNDPDGTGSGGGGAGADAYTPDPNDMFTIIDVGQEVLDKLKSMWENADFSDLGKNLAQRIKEGLQDIPWEDIKETAYNIGKSFATFLNGFLSDPTVFEEAGIAVAEGLNTIGQALAGFFDNYEKGSIGSAIANFFKGVFETFDWGTAGANLGEFVTTLFTELSTFLREFPNDDVVTGIEEFFQGIKWEEVVASVFEFIGTSAGFVGKVAKGIAHLLDNVTSEDIVAAFDEVDWTEVSDGIGEIIGAVIALTFTSITLPIKIWKALLTGIANALLEDIKNTGSMDKLQEGIEENDWVKIGQAMIDGLFYGIGEAMMNAGTWVADNIIAPIVDAVKEGFGIHSPSTVFEEFGENLIEGLKLGIENLVDSVMDPFNTLKDNLVTKWEEVKTDASNKWSEIKSNVTEKAGELKDKATEKVEELKTNLVGKWQEIKGSIYEKLVGIKLNVVDVFEQMKEAVKDPVNGFIDIVEDMVNKVVDGINWLARELNGLPDVQFSWMGKDYELGFNIPMLDPVTIPHLAQGAVIPPNREFMAVLGDQSHGTNIEAPLDTIKQAVAEVMANNGNAEMIQLLQQLIAVVESKNLSIGDKEIGRANARYTNQQNRIRGVGF